MARFWTIDLPDYEFGSCLDGGVCDGRDAIIAHTAAVYAAFPFGSLFFGILAAIAILTISVWVEKTLGINRLPFAKDLRETKNKS